MFPSLKYEEAEMGVITKPDTLVLDRRHHDFAIVIKVMLLTLKKIFLLCLRLLHSQFIEKNIRMI